MPMEGQLAGGAGLSLMSRRCRQDSEAGAGCEVQRGWQKAEGVSSSGSFPLPAEVMSTYRDLPASLGLQRSSYPPSLSLDSLLLFRI